MLFFCFLVSAGIIPSQRVEAGDGPRLLSYQVEIHGILELEDGTRVPYDLSVELCYQFSELHDWNCSALRLDRKNRFILQLEGQTSLHHLKIEDLLEKSNLEIRINGAPYKKASTRGVRNTLTVLEEEYYLVSYIEVSILLPKNIHQELKDALSLFQKFHDYELKFLKSVHCSI
jgi:hypothetical protein